MRNVASDGRIRVVGIPGVQNIVRHSGSNERKDGRKDGWPVLPTCLPFSEIRSDIDDIFSDFLGTRLLRNCLS